MNNWKKIKLKDALVKNGYIRGPFGSALRRGEMQKSGIPVYEQDHAIKEIRHFRYFINDKKYRELKRFTVITNDIIVSCSGTVGRISIIKEGDPKGIISQALLILRSDPSIVDVNYLVYFLRSDIGQNALLTRSNGSVQVNICKRKIVEEISIPLPPLKTQKKIADFLCLIDNKIELNTQINQNLEAQAQSIFKSWFVDFEPFRNGKFVDSELGPIPEGWQVFPLDEVATFLNGLPMQKYRPLTGNVGLPVLKIKELREQCCTSESERCSEDIRPEYIVDDGDIIFSWSGSLLVDIWTGGRCGLNQHLFKVTSKQYEKWFYYLWTRHHMQNFISIAADKATTMGHIQRGHLHVALTLVPSEQEYDELSAMLSPLMDRLVQSRIESRYLAALRDALLPKLMSGEIDVSEMK